ncbi:MAG: tyrosine-type recombinase/integrase [Pyramidobacter sp.]|nr:tyrosine-type recombinase/integrase [Pyramidobacter sp.]
MGKLRQNEAHWSDSDQRWHIHVQYQGVRRHFVSSLGASSRKGKLEAERKADRWLEDQLSDETVRVEVLFDRWIDALKGRTQTAYWKQYESYGRCWIKPVVGKKTMAKLRESDLDTVIGQAYKKGLAKKSLMNIRSCLTAFLKYARKCRATTLMGDEIVLPKAAPIKGKRSMTSEEIGKVFTSGWTAYRGQPRKEFYINLYRFLLFEGLRPGEALGLRWEDIDLAGGEYEIRRAINYLGEITTGKNENARRRHALSEYSRKILDAQKALLREWGIISPWVFPSDSGTCASQRVLEAAWYRYLAHNGIARITLYELRHTNYSVNKDMPSAYKKMLFGHSAKFDGDQVYDHTRDGDLAAAATMNENAFLSIIAKG